MTALHRHDEGAKGRDNERDVGDAHGSTPAVSQKNFSVAISVSP